MTRKRDKRQNADPDSRPKLDLKSLPAEVSEQVPINSYCGAKLVYTDQPFRCRECGKHEIWTARQQKWYYEIAKGSLYATAVRCHDCRARIAEQKRIQRERSAAGAERKKGDA